MPRIVQRAIDVLIIATIVALVIWFAVDRAFADGLPPLDARTFAAQALPAPAIDDKVSLSDIIASVITALLIWVVSLVRPMLLGQAAVKKAEAATASAEARAADAKADQQMHALVKDVAQLLLSGALKATGHDVAELADVKVRRAVLGFVAGALNTQYGKPGDLAEWIDQDQNGKIDFLELVLADVLPPIAAAPKAAV